MGQISEILHFDIRQAAKILTSGIVQYNTYGELPNIGDPEYLYYIQSEAALYMWDAEKLRYVCCGRDYTEIDVIDCGTATTEVKE